MTKSYALIFLAIVFMTGLSGCETTRTERSAGYPVKYPAQTHTNR